MHPNHLAWIAEHQDVAYMVEATSYETLSLWQKHHEELNWQGVTRGGPMFQLGQLDGRPVVLSVDIFEILGRKVMSYQPTSQVVDWVMVEEFLEKNWPHAKTTGAINFSNAVHEIRKLNEVTA